jgi:hypothetical protein
MSNAFRKISQEITSLVSPENANEENAKDLNQVAQEGIAQQQQQQQGQQQQPREGTPRSTDTASSRSRQSSKKYTTAAGGAGTANQGQEEVAEAPAAVGTPINPETGTQAPVTEEKRRGCCAAFLHRCKHPKDKHCCGGDGAAANTTEQSTSGSVGAGGVPVAGAGVQNQ